MNSIRDGIAIERAFGGGNEFSKESRLDFEVRK
jgi:hypothetical protein